MFVQYKKLIGLDVETRSGELLGRVVGFVINTDVHEIEQYEVVPSLIKKFLGKTFLINRKQVVEIKKNKIIVEDGIVKELNLQTVVDV